MSDSAWFIVIGAVLALTGAALCWLGAEIWLKHRIGLLHEYHYDKVSEENKPAFCRLAGIGVLVIGIGFVASGLAAALTGSLLGLIPMTAGIAAGTALLIAAIARYNRGSR